MNLRFRCAKSPERLARLSIVIPKPHPFRAPALSAPQTAPRPLPALPKPAPRRPMLEQNTNYRNPPPRAVRRRTFHTDHGPLWTMN